jgi:uncharacterized repeat protein (TIGR03943 family)
MSGAASAVALGYGAYLLYAFSTGSLYFYIHPIYVVPTLVSGLVLLALTAMAGWTSAPADGHHRRSPIALVIFALPVAVGFLVPAQPLSISAASQRGVEVASLGGLEGPPRFDVSRPPEAYTIKDWVKAFHVDPEPARHAGKPVRVTGFVYREDRLPADWFLVARFVVKCCAVDAQPVGLPVRGSGGAPPERGRWVSVEGRWDVADVGGQRRAVIAATTVVPVERPDQPYLY